MSKVISETRVTLHDGQYCPGVPSICGIDLPHRPHKFSPTPTAPAVEAAFRAGFKAGFGASMDGFNGANPFQEDWTDSAHGRAYKDHFERRLQEAEDAAFKAAYPDGGSLDR